MKGYDQRDKYCTNRTVPLWKSLSAEVVNSKNTNQFKARNDKHLNDKKRVSTGKKYD